MTIFTIPILDEMGIRWRARAALFLLVFNLAVQQANGSDFFNKSIDISDPDLAFSPGAWVTEFNTTTNFSVTTTDIIGATVSLNFTGTQIYVIGIGDVGNNGTIGANYTIDGGMPVTQIANLTHQGNETVVFASSGLSYQNHRLLITVIGMPFYDLSGFNITTSNTPPPPPIPSTSASSSSSRAAPTQSSPSMSPPSGHAIAKGAIAGIVIGISILFTLFALCFFYLSRWRRRQRQLDEARRGQGGDVPTHASPPLLGKRTFPPSHGRKRSDREFHSPTPTLVESSSPPPPGGAPIPRRPSNVSRSSQIYNPWPLPVEMAAMEDEQSMLPEVKPPRRLFSREGISKPAIKKQKKEESYSDFRI